MTRKQDLRTGAALFLLTALATPPALAQQVGTAAAVNPASTGKPPGGNVRTLTLGSDVVHNERIQTSAAGSVQLLFVDKTAMSIGPNSDVTIDDYVFDPNAGTGKMAVTVSQGLMRFVGGQVSHSGDATVKTPTASIGIRGGTGIFDVQGGNTRSINLFGHQTVSNAAGSVSLLRPGSMTDVGGVGAVPSVPAPVPLNVLAAYNAVFQAKPGQTGGSGGVSQGEVQTQLARNDPAGSITTNSPGVQDSVLKAAQQSTLPPPVLQNAALAAQQGAQASAAADAQAAAATQPAPPQPVPPQPPTTPVSFPARPFALTMTNCCDPAAPTSGAPYLPGTFAPPGNQVVSPVLGFRNASAATGPAFNGGSTLQYGFNITGAGAAQSSWFFVATARLRSDANGNPVVDGGFAATNRPSATTGIGNAFGPATSTPGSVAVDSFGVPTSYTVNANNFSPETGQFIPDNASARNGGTQTQIPYQFTQQASATPTPAGLGSNRPDVSLTGFAAGLVQSRNQTTGANDGPFAVQGSAAISLGPTTSTLSATFTVQRGGEVGSSQFSEGVFQFGQADTARARSAYVDYDRFGARDSVRVVNAASNTLAPISQVNGQTLNGQTAAMVTVTPADAQQIASAVNPSVTFCQCEFTRWGFWSTDSNRTDPTTGQTISDAGHLMTWVAGQMTDPSLMPQTGTATYNGHVVVNVANAGAQYVNAANFSNTVNFASHTGNVTVGTLDGSGYAGTVSWNQGSSQFNGSFGSTNETAARTMTMNGAFFNGAAGPAGEMGGTVKINGPQYLASGIFLGKH